MSEIGLMELQPLVRITRALLVLACAWLVFRIATQWRTPEIPAGISAASAAVQDLPQTPGLDAYAQIQQRDLFRGGGALRSVSLREPVTATQLPVRLLGTVCSTHPEQSLAIVRESSERRSKVVRVGSQILGARVVEIRPKAVLVSRSDRIEWIALQERTPGGRGKSGRSSSSSSSSSARSRGAASGPPPPLTPTPTAEPQNTAAAAPDPAADTPEEGVDREEALRRLSEQARFVPQFNETGGIKGVSVTNLSQGGSLWRAGFREGDVVTAVGGQKLEAPESVEILRRIPLLAGLDVDLMRGGVPMRIHVAPGSL